MATGEIKGVLCPCCGQVLYKLLSVQGSDEVGEAWVRTTDSPAIGKDNEGNFVTCPHCSKRIAMAPVTGDTSGTAFDVAQDQKCIPP